jgi:predicted P-loop ATPase
VEVAGQAVQTAARDRPFHPVKAYLQCLHWDGVERVERWLWAYLRAEDTEYSRAVGSRWLVSAEARVLRPGAKADCCLILEGGGIRKSTALRNPRRRVLHRRTGGPGEQRCGDANEVWATAEHTQ